MSVIKTESHKVVGWDKCHYCLKHHTKGSTILYAIMSQADNGLGCHHYEAYCNKRCLLLSALKESK